jgi:hypothetical protein
MKEFDSTHPYVLLTFVCTEACVLDPFRLEECLRLEVCMLVSSESNEYACVSVKYREETYRSSVRRR